MTGATTRSRRAALAAVVALAPLLATSAHQRSGRARLQAFSVPAGRFALRVVRAGHGTSLVLLHGYGESLLAWREVFPLVASDFDAIAVDLPGFGLSTKPASGYAVDSFAVTVVRALDGLGVRRAILVGHSLGGAVAAAVATTYPDRVVGLVLVDPVAVAMPWPLSASGADLSQTVRRGIASYYKIRASFSGVHDPEWLAESDSALAYNPASDPAYRIALQAVLREFDFAYLTPERAKRLEIPLLLLWGEYDPVVPLSAGRVLAASLPGARLVVVPRSWHRPHEERPVEVAARIAAFARRLAPANTRLAH